MAQYSGVTTVLGSLEGEWPILENYHLIVYVVSLQFTEGTNVVSSGTPRPLTQGSYSWNQLHEKTDKWMEDVQQ